MKSWCNNCWDYWVVLSLVGIILIFLSDQVSHTQRVTDTGKGAYVAGSGCGGSITGVDLIGDALALCAHLILISRASDQSGRSSRSSLLFSKNDDFSVVNIVRRSLLQHWTDIFSFDAWFNLIYVRSFVQTVVGSKFHSLLVISRWLILVRSMSGRMMERHILYMAIQRS